MRNQLPDADAEDRDDETNKEQNQPAFAWIIMRRLAHIAYLLLETYSKALDRIEQICSYLLIVGNIGRLKGINKNVFFRMLRGNL